MRVRLGIGLYTASSITMGVGVVGEDIAFE